MRRIGVFCGSSRGFDNKYADTAAALSRLLAAQHLGLVYGGGNVGLMGIVADGVMAAGGEVIGVIPESLEQLELAHQGISELRVVKDMHERKAMMAELSDGFIAMPGGIGTLEEIMEIYTWAQLAIHQKPFGLLNVAGYFDPLIAMLDKMVEEGFLKQEQRELMVVASEPEALLKQLKEKPVVSVAKWIR